MDNELNKMLENSFKDPIMNILLQNCNLTKIQFESLLIEHYMNNRVNNIVTFENKAIYRSKKVSRGSFRRTLSQARKNVISSIYTGLLLSYIGIYDTYPFEEYKNLTEKLSEYTFLRQDSETPEYRSRITRIETELVKGIRSLAQPGKLKQL
tara:strand:+ start:169 stop:624 length:456 start_codon:yes stop_codon:yes gene_type:complete